MEDLSDYLRSRHVSEGDIQRMEQEKIDSSVIHFMTDDQLREYLPSYGDRLAVFGFCRQNEKEPSSRKSKLFERLKRKLSKNNDNRVSQKNHQTPQRNAQKTDRKIEIGWMNFREGEFVQVRTKKGGGTRKESVPKDNIKQSLIEKAALLFFPGGLNAEGSLADFDIDLTDFQQHSLDSSITVGELYEKTKLPLLRFYLTNKMKDIVSDINLEENSDATAQEGEKTCDRPAIYRHSPDTSATDAVEINTSDIIYVGSSIVFANENSSSESVSLLHTTVDPTDASRLLELDTLHHEDALEDSGIVTFLTESISGMEYSGLDDTLPLSQELSFGSALPPSMDVLQEQANQRERVNKMIVLHRGQILRELIEEFSKESIMEDDIYFQLILPDGKLEMAVDDGGVLRDVLSEFWKDFYEQCTVGNGFKVPYLRHDFGKGEWESVGRIITFGWQKEKYLPVKLAPVILEQAVLGFVESDVVDCFFKYVPESERVVLESCRSDFEGVDLEELLEILDIHNCRRLPTAHSIEQILRELAHQKLIQKPAFVLEQWSNMLAPIRSELKGIAAVYEELQPTSRKIMRSITYPSTQNAQDKLIVKYVSAYLRESDNQHLCLFLRFCTGSDLFTGKNITVSFTQLQGFQRRPVAHTCGCYLELPVSYDNYPDFRHEMNKVLESNVCIMDIA